MDKLSLSLLKSLEEEELMEWETGVTGIYTDNLYNDQKERRERISERWGIPLPKEENKVMENSSNSYEETGNISKSPSEVIKGKKQVSPKKYWHFVLNNWTEEEYQDIISVDSSIVPCLVINKEVGSETGTPHLQGFLEFDEKRRPMGYFKSNRICWSGMYQKSKPIDGKRYCSKLRTRVEGTEPYCRGWSPKYHFDMDLRPWQQKVVDLVDTVPDERTIHWIWEPDGGIGKTVLQKWLYCNREGVLMLAGKKADMSYGIVGYCKNHDGNTPKVVLINIPRSDENKVSYSGMEQIKDMFFFSSKYEGEMVCGAQPHLLVFANFPPEYNKMSCGRWNIINLKENTDDDI